MVSPRCASNAAFSSREYRLECVQERNHSASALISNVAHNHNSIRVNIGAVDWAAAPGRRDDGTRVDGIRCRDRGRRAGRPGGGDPAAAVGDGGWPGGFGLRDREGLRGRRPHPLGRGPGAARARRAAARLEGVGRTAQHPGRGREIHVACWLSRPSSYESVLDSCLRRNDGGVP